MATERRAQCAPADQSQSKLRAPAFASNFLACLNQASCSTSCTVPGASIFISVCRPWNPRRACVRSGALRTRAALHVLRQSRGAVFRYEHLFFTPRYQAPCPVPQDTLSLCNDLRRNPDRIRNLAHPFGIGRKSVPHSGFRRRQSRAVTSWLRRLGGRVESVHQIARRPRTRGRAARPLNKESATG